MEFMNDKCLRNKNQKNNSDIIVYDFELKIGSIQNANNSLNNEIEHLTQSKNNNSQNEKIYLDNLSNILIKRNKLINMLLFLFFKNIKELINK